MPRGPFVPISGACKVEILSHNLATGRPVVNVMHALCGTSPTGTHLTNIASAFQTAMVALESYLGSQWKCTEIQVTDLNTSTGPQVVVTSTATGIKSALSPGQCVVVDLITALRGARYRGRVYFPGSADDINETNGLFGSTYITNIATVFDNLMAALGGLSPSVSLAVVSRKGAFATAVNDAIPRAAVGNIRRRQTG